MVRGRAGITATVIQDSRHERTQRRITTFELEYPRFIHSEFMTHRQLSRNAASSRAIPVSKLIRLIESQVARPVEWGKNIKGMKAIDIMNVPEQVQAADLWHQSAREVCAIARELDRLGVHKQIANRILEPYQYIKVVCTATEFDNFFYLRKHPDAQPEIKELATVMWSALEQSSPLIIGPGAWHVPYVDREIVEEDCVMYNVWESSDIGTATKVVVDQNTAIKISASCCAQVSYRVLNTDILKAEDIYDRLVNSKPVHASPFEHQATPMKRYKRLNQEMEMGITHTDIQGQLWSSNFRDWIQHRQLIKDNVCIEFGE